MGELSACNRLEAVDLLLHPWLMTELRVAFIRHLRELFPMKEKAPARSIRFYHIKCLADPPPARLHTVCKRFASTAARCHLASNVGRRPGVRLKHSHISEPRCPKVLWLEWLK